MVWFLDFLGGMVVALEGVGFVAMIDLMSITQELSADIIMQRIRRAAPN
jgi:hypothetical protein